MSENDGGFSRIPPYDEEAERGVLAGMMFHRDSIPDLVGVLEGHEFYKPAHETLYRTMVGLAAAGEPLDPITITDALRKSDDLTRVGGPAAVSSIASQPYAIAEPLHYARIVSGQWARRQALQTLDQGRESVRSGNGDLEDVLTKITSALASITGDPVAERSLVSELLDTDGLDTIPNLEPLIADMLFLDTLSRVNGPSGHGKSFVALDFAGHVGVGLTWHGRPVRQGSVIYLVAEGAKGIRKRVRAWEKHHGQKMRNVYFLPRPVQSMEPEWQALINLCGTKRPVLVVLDTQARVTVGVEENSATEMGRVVDRMEQLRAASGACVLLIHHKGLNGDHGRGSSAVKGAMQTELTVTKTGKGADTRVVIGTDKQKDSEEIESLGFSLRQVSLDGEAEEDGRPVTSAVLEYDGPAPEGDQPKKLAPAAKKLLTALRSLDVPVPRAQVVDRVAEQTGNGLTREVSSRHLNEMAKDGLVDRIDSTDRRDASLVLWAVTEKGRKA
ncbi:AAA family ATPase [Streptomyces odonnellii]|uniref:AAA family ATPase n=1 Tax=Streptomyces odonnellii TaxID=1417980 RepID=UPI0006255C11|nr:AAA family ATPase [Streptomyces odonnellii]